MAGDSALTETVAASGEAGGNRVEAAKDMAVVAVAMGKGAVAAAAPAASRRVALGTEGEARTTEAAAERSRLLGPPSRRRTRGGRLPFAHKRSCVIYIQQ
jgi:hypothetical protein